MKAQPVPAPKSPLGALAPLGFLLQSLLCQGVALGAGVALRSLSGGWPGVAGGWWASLFLIAQAVIAWGLACWAKLPPVWQLFNLALVPGILSLASFDIPALPLTIILVVGLLLYIPTFWTRVPYYPTSLPTYERIAELLPNDRPFKMVDLGCGFAPLLRFLGSRFPNGEFLGVEISPLAFLGAWVRSIGSPNVSIRFRSIWLVELESFDVVYAFLAPGPMPRLWAKVEDEMAPNSVFISNTFPAPPPADEVIAIPDRRGAHLYIYHSTRGC